MYIFVCEITKYWSRELKQKMQAFQWIYVFYLDFSSSEDSDESNNEEIMEELDDDEVTLKDSASLEIVHKEISNAIFETF